MTGKIIREKKILSKIDIYIKLERNNVSIGVMGVQLTSTKPKL